MTKVTCSKCGKDGENKEFCTACGYKFKSIRKLSFKEKVMNASPEQLNKVELIGLWGNLIGVVLVSILLIIFGKALWYLFLAFIFSIFITISQIISKYQQLRAIRQFNKTFIIT